MQAFLDAFSQKGRIETEYGSVFSLVTLDETASKFRIDLILLTGVLRQEAGSRVIYVVLEGEVRLWVDGYVNKSVKLAGSGRFHMVFEERGHKLELIGDNPAWIHAITFPRKTKST